MSVYTLADIIAKQSFGAEPQDERVALVCEDRSCTYAELEDRSERLAAGLHAAGFAHGDRMCVLMHNRIEWFEAFFALARLGGVLVPVNHLLTPREIGYVVEDSGARWFVSDDLLWDKVAAVREDARDDIAYVAVGERRDGALAFADLLAPERLPEAPAVSVDDVFLLQYTSGTTGFPKGAIHTHSTVMWNAFPQRQPFSVDASTVYLCLPAMSWVAGFHSLCLETLWAGGTVIVSPSTLPFDPARFCATIEEHGVTHVALVPTVMRRLLALDDLEDHDLGSLRVAITGGESVPVHLLEEMDRRLPALALIQVYGMSEFPSLVTLLPADEARTRIGSAGHANAVSQVRVVDDQDRDLPTGEIGEILTRSPATMLGYHGQPEATRAALAGGWLHTGDLGRLDADGYLYISGRSKDLIISGGLNIYPAEIEHELARHPAVAEAAVVGRPSEQWGEVATAVVVLEAGTAADAEELRTFLAASLARFKIPKEWEIRTEPPLPRTASGKLQKFKLVAS